MQPQRYRISGADFDEVSTVDVPANQHGLFVLAKRADEETQMQYFDAEGEPVDIDSLAVGTYVQDEEGGVFQIEADDAAYDGTQERELETVGKSAFFDTLAVEGESIFQGLSKALNEAVSDEAARTQIAKAFSEQAVELAKANARAEQAVTLAQRVVDRQELDRYIAKANSYEGLPVKGEELAPVLQRMSKSMSHEDCAVIAKILDTRSDIFKTYGVDGDHALGDPLSEIEEYANANAGELAKSLGDGRTILSKEAASTAFFDANPRDYTLAKRASRARG